MTYSFATHLVCARCGETYGLDGIHQLCGCGAPLLVVYDLERLKAKRSRQDLRDRPQSLWRYHELLPVPRPDLVVSLGETVTPVVRLPSAGARVGLPNLAVKDEGLLPTGSFKARGAAVGVSMAKALGVRHLAMPTNGNAGAAWSAYAARAGIKATVVMPESAPRPPRVESHLYGADLYLVRGLIDDAGRIVAEAIAREGLYDASTLKEPYRVEGKKTMALEIAEAYGWDVPDVIVYPTGGGVGLIGMWKGFRELSELGWISRMPRFVAVQSEGCQPIVRAYREGKDVSDPWPGAHTVAFGINVPKALGDFLVLRALKETGGTAVAVSDEAILAARADLSRTEGMLFCPEGAATFVAAAALRESGWIGAEERVLLLNTGSGQKYLEDLSPELPLLPVGATLPRTSA